MALVVGGTLTAALFDSRFWYVAAIEVLIVFPMTQGLVWAIDAVTDDTLRECRKHTIEVLPDGLTVSEVVGDRNIVSHYPWSDFRGYSDRGDCVVIQWNQPRRKGIRLPGEVFDNQQWIEVATILARNLNAIR